MGRAIVAGGKPAMEAPSGGILASELAVGSTVKLMENGSPAEYLVVHSGLPSSIYDSSCNGLWLLRKDIYTISAWNSINSASFHGSVLSTVLNNFYNTLGSVEKEAIKEVTLNSTTFKAFVLGGFEVGWTTSTNSYLSNDSGTCLSYFSGLGATDSKRIAKYGGTASAWWLRTKVSISNEYVFYVDSNGGCNYGHVAKDDYGVRPAVILPLTAKFNASTMLLEEVA